MKLWGGRFAGNTDQGMRHFSDSFAFDRRLYAADIKGSMAYARALAAAGLISVGERDSVVAGLDQVQKEFDAGTFESKPDDEDIHTAVERRLMELIGAPAGKLHMGRSRNDQVSTDLRLYLLDEAGDLGHVLAELQQATVDQAEARVSVIMPGYTHMQQAQPLLFSHWVMSFFWKLQRDRERLGELMRRTSVMPLGAGALAGNPFDIARQVLAAELGFAAITENSLDAVSDRDFVVEFLAWAALLQVHLSGMAEDLIVWSSHEFGFVQLDEAYSTGSSLMPQKRNPDPLELMRGKTGRMAGHLVSLLVTLKGLPSGYNRDLQEDKQALFDAVDTLREELPIAASLIRSLKVHAARMTAALDDAMLATDLADYLVGKGVPFRLSHQLVGRAVKRAEELGVRLHGLELAEYQALHPAFEADLYAALDFRRSVERRETFGGTATSAVRAQIRRARHLLQSVQTASTSAAQDVTQRS